MRSPPGPARPPTPQGVLRTARGSGRISRSRGLAGATTPRHGCASWTRSAAAPGPSTRSCSSTRSSARGHEGAPGTRWWNGSRSGLVAEADLDGGLPVRDLVAVDLPPDRLEFEPVEVTDRSGRLRDGVGYRGVGPVGRRPHDLDDVVDPLGHDDLLVPHGCASGPRHSTVR